MFLLLGAMFLAMAPGSDAQIRWSPPRAIFVNVVNRDLSPLPGATVALQEAGKPEGEAHRTATANAGGHVEFRDLPGGSYVVRIRLSGYLDMTFGPMPIEEKDPPGVRVPQILAVANPVMVFEEASR
jgi:hypothetical protein